MTTLFVRKITNLSKNEYVSITKIENVSAVPSVGEVFNFDSKPYLVHKRMWATTSDTDNLYCYIEIIKPDFN